MRRSHSRGRVLDLCCCAGGATRGYQDAGFHVTGVDIEKQPNYCGDMFVRADAIEYVYTHGHRFDFIHASPPCQAYTPLNAYNKLDYPDLVAPMRAALLSTGRPFVIENVPQAPLKDAITLCGPMFGLRVYRHRAFEPSPHFALTAPPHPAHVARCARNGYPPTAERPFMTITGGRHSEAWRQTAAKVMGVPWTRTIREVCEAIPPAYTYHVARAALAHLHGGRAAA